MHCDVGERDAQVKVANVTPKLSITNNVCEEDENVDQAQNCDLVEYLDHVASRVFQRLNCKQNRKHDHGSDHLNC